MARIKESPKNCSESYTVKFWYCNNEGLYEQGEETFYCNSKSAHATVENYFVKYHSYKYFKLRIITVTCN